MSTQKRRDTSGFAAMAGRALLVLVAVVACLACEIPARRNAPFPTFTAVGLLGGKAAAPLSPPPKKTDDEEEATEEAASPTATVQVIQTAVLGFDADLIGYLDRTPGRGWQLHDAARGKAFLHLDDTGAIDAAVTVVAAPVHPAIANVDHLLRWRSWQDGPSDAAAAGLATLARMLVRSPKSAKWLLEVASPADAIALYLMERIANAGPLPMRANGASFTGWRWTGANADGVHLRFGQVEAELGLPPWADWNPVLLGEIARSAVSWAHRVPQLRERAGELLRGVRLQLAPPSIQCAAFAACELVGAASDASPTEDGAVAPNEDATATGEGESFAVLYDELGRRVAKASDAELNVTGETVRWSWRGGRPGRYLFRWANGRGGPFDPKEGQALRVDVGERTSEPMTVAFGYIDPGQQSIHGSQLTIACRSPCPVAPAIATLLKSLCRRTDTTCTTRFTDHAARDGGTTKLEDLLLDLSSPNVVESGFGALAGVLGDAGLDKNSDREALHKWWRGEAPIPHAGTSTQGTP